MADARLTAYHMMIDDVDHECTKVVYNMAETATARVFRDWTVSSPIRVNDDHMSRFVVMEVTHHRDGLDLDGT